jgi:hypothetical protein
VVCRSERSSCVKKKLGFSVFFFSKTEQTRLYSLVVRYVSNDAHISIPRVF